ncbi:hypothetical protein D6850_19010 [Roseovarius spongiae]|uniref:Uncharacterized protein n=1 Tax=Roseovarius spongiae TaxID=2320272 RepID=A0A3A8B705_9RHOB|nr:hypothetical protein D6850_19010 [Roseovarius spongiae]
MTVVSSWGCLVLNGERRLRRLITGHEGSPPRSAPNLAHRHDRRLFLSLVRAPSAQAGAGATALAIAQMKPTISRAMAVMTTTFALPAVTRWR